MEKVQSTFMIYHILVKMSLHPDWIQRFKEFWESIESLGFAKDDGVITVENENDAQNISNIASEYNIEVTLVKQ